MHYTLKIPKENHSFTAPSDQILLALDSLQFHHKKITHTPGQKLPPPRKEYLYFQMDGKAAQDAQCAKSRALTKVIGLIFYIHLFDQKCVIYKRVVTVRTTETTYDHHWSRLIIK